MNTDSMTLYKLIILDMLDKVDFPLTNSQISEFILEKGYASYFSLQQALCDLNDTELIRIETQYRSSFYTLTPAGEETLQEFKNRIPDTIREEIKEFIKSHRYHMRNENEYVADYFRNGPDSYTVTCKIRSRNEILNSITMNVPGEEQAKIACENWKKHYEEIYTYLTYMLLSEKKS